MKVDVNYPRMMFHRSQDPVTVYSAAEESALGPGWSRKMFASLPHEEKPAKVVYPEPEEPPDEEPEEEPEPEEQPAHTEEAVKAPPAKPKRVKPAAHQPPHKKTAHKRG